MAIEVSFEILTNTARKYFDFVEKTGTYSALSKPGGYGAPNPATTDMDWARLTVTLRGSGVTHTVTMPVPPSDTENLRIPVNNTDIGLTATDKIPDGIYEMVYSVGTTVAGTDVITSQTDMVVAFTEGLKCCLSKIRKNIAIPGGSACGCEDKMLEKVSNAQALLDGICYLVKCDQLDRAEEVMTYLEGFCECNCQECE